jgi:hypothetical protein
MAHLRAAAVGRGAVGAAPGPGVIDDEGGR